MAEANTTQHSTLAQGSLEEEKKVFRNGSFAKRRRVAHMFDHGWWRLALRSWWRLAVGGWWLAVGSWWWLVAVGGGWWLVIGGWWFVVPGGGP